jgi:phosphoglycerate dehydrogenase-like enzyme
MRTIGVRKQVGPTTHFDEVVALSALDSYLPRCDWLILACPLNAETRGLIDARRLALLPRSAGVVNIARGELIDEPALISALQSGTLGWAFLDVFAVEPLAHDSPRGCCRTCWSRRTMQASSALMPAVSGFSRQICGAISMLNR